MNDETSKPEPVATTDVSSVDITRLPDVVPPVVTRTPSEEEQHPTEPGVPGAGQPMPQSMTP